MRGVLSAFAAVAVGVLALSWPGPGLQSALAQSSGLVATVDGRTVTLSWPPYPGATAYRVEAGSAPGLANLAQAVVTAPPAVFADVAPGTYFVRVRAALGAGWSPASNEVTVRVACAAPPAPSGLGVEVNGALVSLSWEGAAGVLAYVLEAGTRPGAADVAALTVAATRLMVTAAPGTYYVRVRAVGPCGTSAPSAEVTVIVGRPPAAPVYGVVDPTILGTCPVAAHDAHVVDGGDGYLYRTWHPQVDPTGCVYAHEHGDDPSRQANAEIRAAPVRFGFIGRRMDHEEPHEGFKVFVANRGDRNDEARISLIDSRVVMHMGTGGPRRFALAHHSMEMRVIGPTGVRVFVQAMSDSDGLEHICAQPRQAGKTVMVLDPACRVGSLYEIWSNTIAIRFRGREVYRGGAATAVFDPITALDPANPARLLYMWDPALRAINVHGNDWSYVRGCDREAYHGIGNLYNGSYLDTGRTIFYTDAMGQELPAADPLALRQEVSRHYVISPPSSDDGNNAFKLHRPHCGLRARLGLKN